MRSYHPPVGKKFSIFLTSKNYSEPQGLYCPNCGKKLMHIYSDIKLVIEGVTSQRDFKENRLTVRCKGCHSDLTIL